MTDKNVILKNTDGLPSTSVNVEWAMSEGLDLVKQILVASDDFEKLLETVENSGHRHQHATVLVHVYALALLGKATGTVITELQGHGMEWAEIIRMIESSLR
jgi:hypothetical protein